MPGAARGERRPCVDRRASRRVRGHHRDPRLLRLHRPGRGRLRHRPERGRQVHAREARRRTPPDTGGPGDLPRPRPRCGPRSPPAPPGARVCATGRHRLQRVDGGGQPHPPVREPVSRPLRGAVRPLSRSVRAPRAAGGTLSGGEKKLLSFCRALGEDTGSSSSTSRPRACRRRTSPAWRGRSGTGRREGAPSSSWNRTSTSSRGGLPRVPARPWHVRVRRTERPGLARRSPGTAPDLIRSARAPGRRRSRTNAGRGAGRAGSGRIPRAFRRCAGGGCARSCRRCRTRPRSAGRTSRGARPSRSPARGG